MKPIKRIIVLLCAALMLFSMSGCRYSSVVERIIYDYLRANQTDMEKNTYDDKEDNEMDDLLNDLEKDDESDRENDAEEAEPIYEPEQEPTMDDSAGDANYDEDSKQNNAAAMDPTVANDGEISGSQSADDSSSGDDSSSAPGEGIIPDHDGEMGTSGGDTTRLVVDDYGRQYEVPQNMDTVAAVDSAAVAVLMLGGVDRLAATNEDLTADPLAAAVFSGLTGIPSLWAESGTAKPLSSSALQRLIEIHPDVCFETSGCATFTDAQVRTLRENGIYYVVLPAPSSITNLKLIAQIVGEVLGDHTADGGYNSISLAQEYRFWVDKTVSAVSRQGDESTYTLYVDDWDTEAYYTIDQASKCYGYGAAVIQNARTDSCAAVSNFLADASITNVTSLGAFSRTESIYFTPIDINYSTVTVTGSAAGRLTPVKLLVAGNYLGSDHFRTVIAGSTSVKEELESNELWKNFGVVTSSNGNFTDYGFLDDYGEIVRSTIAGDYTVVVNPKGIGSWAGGSVESILETVWASYAINGGCSEDDVRDLVSDFYSTFYRYTLSDKQLDAILAGEP
ncbi:MAG: hypothetical protein ACI3XJ_01035 [Oscillospiraceae bacterium]